MRKDTNGPHGKERKMSKLVTSSKVLGRLPDGTPQRLWTEDHRVFIEGYGYVTTTMGYRIGVIQVREITPTNGVMGDGLYAN